MNREAEKIELIITEDMDGTRLDLVLSAALEEFSRSFLQKLLESGKVWVNGTACMSKKQKATAGDHITLELPPVE